MKNYLLFLGILVFSLSACEKEDPRLTADTLHHDGDNLAAPQLPEGTYETAAKFTFNKLQRFQGRELYEVNLYIESVPTNVELKIYGEGSETEPGTILYQADWNGLDGNSWNDHTLTSPIDITGEELWISINFRHPSEMRSIGCDPGPADTNGDWMLSYDDPGWQTLRDFSNDEVNINWNIRAQTRE